MTQKKDQDLLKKESGLKITKIEKIQYRGDVYNLHVKDNHNYYANNILVSNCHTAKATEICSILEKCTDVSYRFGFTGSLDKSKSNKMVIRGLLGDVVAVAKTKELQDRGLLSQIKIKALVLNYSKETRSLFKQSGGPSKKKVEYKDEINFLVSHERRNKFIRNLALAQAGTTLILFNFREQGDTLYNLISEKAGERKVNFIHGGVDKDNREDMRLSMISQKNSINICSYGTFATGVNVPNIDTIIFASPYKSLIRILQSIGRGLRLSEGKTHCQLFDIADRLSGGKVHANYSYQHLVERLKIYVSEEFPYVITEVEIE